MTEVRLERIPMPRLTTYVAFSVLSLALSLLHLYRESASIQNDGVARADNNETLGAGGHIVSNKPSVNSKEQKNETDPTVILASIFEENFTTLMGIINYFRFILRPLMAHPWCFWSLINMGYCFIVLIGFTVQSVVFGELREYERQHVLDQFWNFVFYKFIFVGGVITPDFQGVLAWSCWFSIIGFLHLLTNLTKERFDFLTHSPSTSYFKHFKLVMLLSVVLCCSTALALISIISAFYADSVHLLCFMMAEVVLLGATTIHVLVRFGIHLYEEAEPNWQHKAVLLYYTDLLFDFLDLSMNTVHYCHMLMHNFSISVASLVILLQMRYYIYGLRRRMMRHLKYRQLVRFVEETFPEMKNVEESCAICWELLQSGSCRLSCSHAFHRTCLRSWLERDTTCPTCRFDLALALKASGSVTNQNGDQRRTRSRAAGEDDSGSDAGEVVADATDGTRYFHFDGTRYFNWLPSLHVEVTRSSVSAGDGTGYETVGSSEMEGHLAQLQTMFPHVPAHVLRADLRVSGSLERTIDNILEGRMSMPSLQMPSNPSQVSLDSRGEAPVPIPPPPATKDVPVISGACRDFSVASSNDLEDASDEWSCSQDTGPFDGSDALDGSRFSKSPRERQVLLEDRKRGMFEKARRRFLAKEGCED